MADDLDERKKREEEAKEKQERYEQYKSAARKAENKTVESWVDYITRKEALRRILFPPVNYVQSGLQGGWNWLKENTAFGLLFDSNGSNYVSEGLYDTQSKEALNNRLRNPDEYIEDHTYLTPEHKYAIEKNRLQALNKAIESDPNNINLVKEALKIEKNHLDLMKEFTSKSNGDSTLKAQMNELEKNYQKHLEIVEKADPAFAEKVKNQHNRYKNEELDYKAFLPHFAGGIGTHPANEAKRLITRLGSGAGMELINTIDMDSLPAGDFKTKVENLKKTGISYENGVDIGNKAISWINSIDADSLPPGEFRNNVEDIQKRSGSGNDDAELQRDAVGLVKAINGIDADSLSGDLKKQVEYIQQKWRSGLNEFSNEEANLLLGLCDSEKYTRLTENAFAEQIKGLSDKEKNMFLANPHFGGFKAGGLEGFSTEAVTKYLGNFPHITDYQKVQYDPYFNKEVYSLKGFCSNKEGSVTNPSTVFLYGDPTNDSKDLKNTINHEAAHSVLHALQKNDYMAKDVAKVEKAFETDIKHKLNNSFSGFSLEEGTKVSGVKISSTEKEKDLKSELEGIMGKGKTYPRLNKTMNHLKAMGVENPTPELIKTLDGMVYGGDGLISSDGRKVPNNLNNIKDDDIRFMVAVSYFHPTKEMDDKTKEQFVFLEDKMKEFNTKNEEVVDAHLDVFIKPVVSSGYNKEQHNEEKLVRFIADEQNVTNLMQTKFSNDTSVTKEKQKAFKEGVESAFKVQQKYEELQNYTYNLCENPNPISAIWNRQIKPSHAHSHERTDGSVMNHGDVIPTKPRTDFSKENEAVTRVSKNVGKEPSQVEKLANQNNQETIQTR